MSCTKSRDMSYIPVLFVISVRNYLGYHAFRMNDERYTAYPQEQEYLLMEGIFLWVMKVEELLVEDWDNNDSSGGKEHEGEEIVGESE